MVALLESLELHPNAKPPLTDHYAMKNQAENRQADAHQIHDASHTPHARAGKLLDPSKEIQSCQRHTSNTNLAIHPKPQPELPSSNSRVPAQDHVAPWIANPPSWTIEQPLFLTGITCIF